MEGKERQEEEEVLEEERGVFNSPKNHLFCPVLSAIRDQRDTTVN